MPAHLTVKRGNPSKPTYNKAYVTMLVCTVTKSVHLELVRDLSTEAFSCLQAICKPKSPDNVHSDNGRNFRLPCSTAPTALVLRVQKFSSDFENAGKCSDKQDRLEVEQGSQWQGR